MHKSLPAPPLTQMHTQPSAGTHTQTQQLIVLSPLNCNTPRLLFSASAQGGTEWCNMKHQLQIAENGSYWKGSAAIRGQSLYVHPGAASAAPLWNPEDTRKHTHAKSNQREPCCSSLHHKIPTIETHTHTDHLLLLH